MAQAPQAQVKYQYVDRPEIAETFADFVNRIQFDGQTLRLRDPDGGPGGGRPKGHALSGLPSRTVRGRCRRPHEQDATDHRQLIKAGVLKADQPKPPPNLA